MRYKIYFLSISIFFASILPTAALAVDVSLFDHNGYPVAYIDTNDNDRTIYLWNGDPVAYLYEGNNDISIYGFNGKHLGWFKNGIIWDHDGYAVGFVKDALSVVTHYEPYKGFKNFKPFKNFKDFKPFNPVLMNTWSSVPLKYLLLLGEEN